MMFFSLRRGIVHFFSGFRRVGDVLLFALPPLTLLSLTGESERAFGVPCARLQPGCAGTGNHRGGADGP